MPTYKRIFVDNATAEPEPYVLLGDHGTIECPHCVDLPADDQTRGELSNSARRTLEHGGTTTRADERSGDWNKSSSTRR
jgi:hypothetical protein